MSQQAGAKLRIGSVVDVFRIGRGAFQQRAEPRMIIGEELKYRPVIHGSLPCSCQVDTFSVQPFFIGHKLRSQICAEA